MPGSSARLRSFLPPAFMAPGSPGPARPAGSTIPASADPRHRLHKTGSTAVASGRRGRTFADPTIHRRRA